MLPGFVRRSIAVSGRGAVLGFYLNQVGWVFFFVLGVFLSMLVGCGGGGEDVRGASATLSWDPGHGTAGIIYTVHYGKSSTGELGSCDYEHSVDVSEPYAMIKGLEPSTHYYFAVSAYNGERSVCSNEVSKFTPEQEFHIGDAPVQMLTPNEELYIGDPPAKL